MQSANLIGEANQRVLLLDSTQEPLKSDCLNANRLYSWTNEEDKSLLVNLLNQGIQAGLATTSKDSNQARKAIKENLQN